MKQNGLVRSDYKAVHGKDVSGWKTPDEGMITRNARRIRGFVKRSMMMKPTITQMSELVVNWGSEQLAEFFCERHGQSSLT
jgi:hypothetical protein